MLNVSDEIKNLYAQDSLIKYITINVYKNRAGYKSGSKIATITNKDIISESMVLTESVCEAENLELGNITSSQFEIDITNSVMSNITGNYIEVLIKIEGNEYNLPLFHGTVETAKISDNRLTRHIVAHDDVYNILDTDITIWYKNYWKKYPNQNTIKKLRENILKYFGVDFETQILPNDDMVFIVNTYVANNEITARKLLKNICEINGCFGIINRNNKFEFRILNDIELIYPSNTIYPQVALYPGWSLVNGTNYFEVNSFISTYYGEYKTLKINKLNIYGIDSNGKEYLIGTIDEGEVYPRSNIYPNQPTQNESSIYPGLITDKFNQYEIRDNILFDSISAEFSQLNMYQIYNAIKGNDYTPVDYLKIKGVPFVEVGDVININDGNIDISFPLLSRTLTGIQSLTDDFSAKGEEYINKEQYI